MAIKNRNPTANIHLGQNPPPSHKIANFDDPKQRLGSVFGEKIETQNWVFMIVGCVGF